MNNELSIYCEEVIPTKYAKAVCDYILSFEKDSIFNPNFLTFMHCGVLDVYGEITNMMPISDENCFAYALGFSPVMTKVGIGIKVHVRINNYGQGVQGYEIPCEDIAKTSRNLVRACLIAWFNDNIRRFLINECGNIHESEVFNMYEFSMKQMLIIGSVGNVQFYNDDGYSEEVEEDAFIITKEQQAEEQETKTPVSNDNDIEYFEDVDAAPMFSNIQQQNIVADPFNDGNFIPDTDNETAYVNTPPFLNIDPIQDDDIWRNNENNENGDDMEMEFNYNYYTREQSEIFRPISPFIVNF